MSALKGRFNFINEGICSKVEVSLHRGTQDTSRLEFPQNLTYASLIMKFAS